MRIVYCTDSMCYLGGIQNVTIAKANALAKVEGNEVWIVVADGKYPPLAPLYDVHFVNLDVNYCEDDWKGFFFVLKGFFVKRSIHKHRLWKKLNEIKPDIVISTGTSEKFFLPTLKICSHPCFVREIHFTSNYRVLYSQNVWEKLMGYVGFWYDFRWKIKKYDQIVLLTEEDRERYWKGNQKVIVIPNPVISECSRVSCLDETMVVAAGRFVPVKNFEALIRIWSAVVVKHPDWKLKIYGEGCQETVLRRLIKSLSLEGKVFLMGRTSAVLEKMADASMFVLTSMVEGFGLVLIEAMSVGLPVVSYACPCGPSDIIADGENGYLIPVGDERMFVERVCSLIEDKEKRISLGRKGKEMSAQYNVDKIRDRWMSLFEELRKQK